MSTKKNKKNKGIAIQDNKDIEFAPNDILGGVVNNGRDAKTGEMIVLDDKPRDYKAEIEKIPVEERIQTITLVNPVSGEKQEIVIDRNGMTDKKLANILLDEKLNDDEKASALSLHLFERGRESSSFIVDLMVSKGQLFRSTNEFKTQVRFDFTVFLQTFYDFLIGIGQEIISDLELGVGITELEAEAFNYIRENRGTKLIDFITNKFKDDSTITRTEKILIKLALNYASEADLLKQRIEQISVDREKEKGKGILLDSKGKPYQYK
jgi:hypothetical protein